MKDNWLKEAIRTTFFRPGVVRTICFGPLRGMKFRVSPITGLSPWYSGTERDHQHVFNELLKPGDIAVDIGANWGLHALYLSRLVGPSGQVVAIEPYPPAFTELEWHLSANQCSNVTPLAIAISDHNGEASFIPGENASTGSLGIIASQPNQQSETIAVPVRTLDSVVDAHRIERLDLVKIDVEGAEALVLHGAEEAVTQFRPQFVIDLHTPKQDILVAQWLTERGYRLQRLSGPPILRTDVGWPEATGVWGSILAPPE